MRQRLASLAALVSVSLLAACGGGGSDDPPPSATVSVLSSRSDMVSGGSALVAVTVPSGATNTRVAVNGTDATPTFKADTSGRLVGLVSTLSVGSNTIRVTGDGLTATDKVVTNYSSMGPIFSGTRETPFYCGTVDFRLPASTATLGAALDENCSVATRVDYVYKNTVGTFVPLPSARPTDIATTVTSLGKTVPYIVRVETGSINRAIYETAVLSDPASEPTPTIQAPPAAWNQRLVYTFGGGCPGGWYIQGSSIGNSGILEDLMLKQGYAVASSTLNVFGNNCNHVLAAETAMMVKERLVKSYGVPKLTIGYGCSGGSEQLHPIGDAYPGIVDGMIVGCSFPDVTASMILNLTDADLWNHYVTASAIPWADSEQIAVTGYPNTTTPANLATYATRIKSQGGPCSALVTVGSRYDRATNPTGVRCDIYDHNINIYGKDPLTGFARRPLDNVGVQYGLNALNAGRITKAQFIDLNRNIGGYDNDGNYIATRTVGDLTALDLAYKTGQVTFGGLGLKTTPIIDYRGYADTPENGQEVHSKFHTFAMRDRLIKANGSYENHVILSDSSFRSNIFNDDSPVLSKALTQMDQWLTSLANGSLIGTATLSQIGAAKPLDLVDACFKDNGTTKIVETQVWKGNTTCNALYPSYSTPRMEAGEALANNVLKCTLKPITTSDYAVTFTVGELAQLMAIFPQGTCNFGVPGVGQGPTLSTWPSFKS